MLRHIRVHTHTQAPKDNQSTKHTSIQTQLLLKRDTREGKHTSWGKGNVAFYKQKKSYSGSAHALRLSNFQIMGNFFIVFFMALFMASAIAIVAKGLFLATLCIAFAFVILLTAGVAISFPDEWAA